MRYRPHRHAFALVALLLLMAGCARQATPPPATPPGVWDATNWDHATWQ